MNKNYLKERRILIGIGEIEANSFLISRHFGLKFKRQLNCIQ